MTWIGNLALKAEFNTQMIKPEVTAVGRLLKAKPGQKHLHKVIAIKADGTVQTLINTPAT